MARADNRYSRFVATLKVLLPLTALALLSTLFLLARVPDSGLTGRITGEIAADGRMRSSTFSAMTPDGPLTVTAEAAIPRSADYATVDLEGLRARLEQADGAAIELTAAEGRLSRPEREAEFAGDVAIVSSEGYRLETERLRTAFDGTWAESPGAVRLTGPGLTLEAGTMRLATGETGRAGGRLLFNGGVRLVYVPEPPAPGAGGSQ